MGGGRCCGQFDMLRLIITLCIVIVIMLFLNKIGNKIGKMFEVRTDEPVKETKKVCRR